MLSFMVKYAQQSFDIDTKLNPGKKYAYSMQAFYGPGPRRGRKQSPDEVDYSIADGLDALEAIDDMLGVSSGRAGTLLRADCAA